jgi:hypothetical protein
MKGICSDLRVSLLVGNFEGRGVNWREIFELRLHYRCEMSEMRGFDKRRKGQTPRTGS